MYRYTRLLVFLIALHFLYSCSFSKKDYKYEKYSGYLYRGKIVLDIPDWIRWVKFPNSCKVIFMDRVHHNLDASCLVRFRECIISNAERDIAKYGGNVIILEKKRLHGDYTGQYAILSCSEKGKVDIVNLVEAKIEEKKRSSN